MVPASPSLGLDGFDGLDVRKMSGNESRLYWQLIKPSEISA